MMATIRITGPDGRVARITPPEGATPEQIEAKVAEVKANWTAAAEPKTSMLGSIARGLGQAAFGLGDEAEALVRAGFDPDKTYSDVIPQVRADLAQSQAEHPYATYGAEILGSVALPMGLASKGIGYTAKAMGQGLPATIKSGIKEGAAYGAAYGAGKSEGDLQNRAEGAIGGGAVGGVVGGLAPAVVAGAGHVVDSFRSNINKIRNPLDEATREVAKTAKASDENATFMRALGLTPQRIDDNPDAANLIAAGAAGQDVRLVDTMGASGRRLLRSATNNSPEAQEIAEAALYPRSQAQGERVIDFVRKLTGRQGNAGQVSDQLTAFGKSMQDPAYKQAMTAGDRPLWSRNLEALTGSDLVKSAMQKAAQTVNSRSIAEGGGAMNVGVQFDNGVMRFTRGDAGRTTYPNLQFWDEVKRNLGDFVGKAKRTGAKNEAAIGTQTVQRLRDELDQMVPEYKNARGIAAQFFKADNALEAGETFAKGRYDFNEVEKALAGMKPMERGMFQEGFVSGYLHKIAGTGDRRDLAKILMGDANARRAFEVAMGKNGARQLEAFLHIEKVMEASKGALGNSTTAQQLKDAGAAGIITGLGGGALSGGYFDPTAAIMGALGKYGAGKVKSNIDNKFAQHIAAILTSKDPKAVNLAMQQLSTPDNLATLRRISAGITGAGANIGANVSAQEGQ